MQNQLSSVKEKKYLKNLLTFSIISIIKKIELKHNRFIHGICLKNV